MESAKLVKNKLKPFAVQVRQIGHQDSGCVGHGKWKQALRSLTPRLLGMSKVAFEEQSEKSITQLPNALKAQFEDVDNQITDAGFKTMMILDWMRVTRSRMKQNRSSKSKPPESVHTYEWEKVKEYGDKPASKRNIRGVRRAEQGWAKWLRGSEVEVGENYSVFPFMKPSSSNTGSYVTATGSADGILLAGTSGERRWIMRNGGKERGISAGVGRTDEIHASLADIGNIGTCAWLLWYVRWAVSCVQWRIRAHVKFVHVRLRGSVV